jgi:glycosyltransferase involved in cell wall biosynthesis
MKILVIGPRGISGHEGGVEKFAEEFVKRTGKHHDISVLCLSRSETGAPGRVEQIVLQPSALLKTDKARYIVEGLRQLASRDFDRVFIMGMNFAILVIPFKLMFWRKPQIVVRSGSIDYKLAKWGRLMRMVMRFAEISMRSADAVIAVAPSIKRHLDTQGIDAVLIRNGLNKGAESQARQPREGGPIVAVGRVTQQKNYGVLVEASRNLGKEGPVVSIIGGADLSQEHDTLRARAAQDGHDRIVFEGALKRDEVLKRLQGAALYVNCSIHEGMSNAVLEAIQQRTPILLSDIEANRDLDLPDHFYFKPDDPAMLADRIRHAIAEPQRHLDTVIARVNDALELSEPVEAVLAASAR